MEISEEIVKGHAFRRAVETPIKPRLQPLKESPSGPKGHSSRNPITARLEAVPLH
jgi:hypothetical protein